MLTALYLLMSVVDAQIAVLVIIKHYLLALAMETDVLRGRTSRVAHGGIHDIVRTVCAGVRGRAAKVGMRDRARVILSPLNPACTHVVYDGEWVDWDSDALLVSRGVVCSRLRSSIIY